MDLQQVPNYHNKSTLSFETNFGFQAIHIRDLFGGDFNLAVWQIFIGWSNLNYAVLTPTHEMN